MRGVVNLTIVLYCIDLYNLYCIVLYCIICIVLYCIVQFVLRCIVMYCIVLILWNKMKVIIFVVTCSYYASIYKKVMRCLSQKQKGMQLYGIKVSDMVWYRTTPNVWPPAPNKILECLAILFFTNSRKCLHRKRTHCPQERDFIVWQH